MAAIAGAGLSLPLALPGLQVAAGSSRNGKIGVSTQTLGSHFLKNLIIQGFDGQKGGVYFGPHTDGSTVIYLGVIAAVLAILAVVIRWRQPMVAAFAVLSVVMVVLAFFAPLASVIDHLPEVGSVRLYDALGPLALAVAVLAGIGTDILVRSHGERRVQWCAGAGFVAAGLVLLGIWVFSRGHLRPVEAVVRNKSFIWPAVETLVGLAVVGAIVFAHRRARQSRDHAGGSWPDVGWLAAAVLLICETVFLVGTGVPTFSSSPAPLKPTPDDILLRQAVGSSVVGLGETCSHIQTLGILLNINVSLQVQEFGVYDPTVPYKYVTAWDALAGKRSAGRGNESNVFCPRVGTAAEGAAIRYRVRPGAPWRPRPARCGVRSPYRQSGPLSHPRCCAGHTDSDGHQRPVPREQRQGHTRFRHPSRSGVMEDHDPRLDHPGLAAAADRYARVARDHRRPTAGPLLVFGHPDPGRRSHRGDTPSKCTTGRIHSHSGLSWPSSPLSFSSWPWSSKACGVADGPGPAERLRPGRVRATPCSKTHPISPPGFYADDGPEGSWTDLEQDVGRPTMQTNGHRRLPVRVLGVARH